MRTELLDQYYDSKEYAIKLRSRFEMLQSCEKEPLNIARYAVDSWAVDPIAFIEQFGWIVNPKYKEPVKPFFLFDYQKDIIIKLWQAELSPDEHEFLVDKVREMGLTWLLVWYFIWRWLFTQNWSGFCLSRSEKEVDDGSADPSSSIFGKIRWSLDMLPEWLMPDGFQPKGKKGTPTDMALRITNPQMKSVIIGSTANQNAGRGARYSFVWVDECFFIEHFLPVHRSLSHVAKTRVYVSTAKTGRSYEKFRDARKEAGDYITLSYKDNPFKDEKWREEKLKEAEYDPEALKEIEVSYTVATNSQYYPEVARSQQAPLIYEQNKPLFVSLDYGRQDHTVLVFSQFDGFNFKIIECVAHNRVDFDWFVPFLNKELVYNPEKYFGEHKKQLEKIRSWKKPLAYFGEPAHKQVHYPSNTSIQKELAKYGIRLIINDYASAHEVRRKALSVLLPRMIFNTESDTVMELFDCIQNSRYAGSVKGTSKEAMLKPVHDDEVGDFRSALENLAVNSPRILRSQRSDLKFNNREEKSTVTDLIKYLKI